jgi:rhodanese-related sulfurtransferase
VRLEFIQNNFWLFLVAVISGAVLVWPWIAKRVSGAKEIGPLEAVQLINRKDALVLDVREAGEFNVGHIAGAKSFPLAVIDKHASDLDRFKSKPVLIACASGSRSHAAFAALSKLGFSELYVLAGGMSAWQQASLPVEK